MRTIATMLLLIAAAFYAGSSFRADRIQSTCESDDKPTVINGSEYVCLSQRHVEMLRQRQQQSWRGGVMGWAGYTVDETTKKQLQDAADMHAGNEPIRDVRDDVVDTEQIDWDAHKRFMRGL